MPNLKISQLDPITSAALAADDVMPIVDTSAVQTKKIAVSELDARWKDPLTALAVIVASLQAQIGYTTFGSEGVPRSITAAGGLRSSNGDMSTMALAQIVFVTGPTPTSNPTISATPQIEAHTVIGATMRVQLASTSGMKFTNGNGMILDGDCFMYDSVAGKNYLDLWWTGSAWRNYGRGF